MRFLDDDGFPNTRAILVSLVLVPVLAFVFTGLMWYLRDKDSCLRFSEQTNIKVHYFFPEGCMVVTDRNLVPRENWRMR